MKNKFFPALTIVTTSLIFVSGCATTKDSGARNGETFERLPVMEARGTTASGVRGETARSVTDLLREADKAFQAANAAQESGDEEAALRQYILMLELLTEADLDPKIFYSLRQEFGAILNSTTQHAGLYQPRTESPLDDGPVQPMAEAGSPGDLSAFSIPFPLPEPVLQEIDRIQNGYPKNFQIFLDRSQKYLPHIRQRLREHGLPEELAYLALVESGFNPKIVSRAGASGMWQFMRPAAQRFNLRVDSHVDERYDWISSTDAAIEYLKVLHNHFGGDWGLALSAYNMGEGGLQRAIEANGGATDLWQLFETPPASNRIKLETKEYFPRFVATVIVAHSPERYGFTVNPAPAEELHKVPVSGAFSLSRLDAQMGYEDGTLARLNPALLNEMTPPSGNYHVLTPRADAERMAQVLSNVQPEPAVRYASDTYKVKRGESVSSIATRHGVSTTELMRINGIRTARGLRAGETLKLPAGAVDSGQGGVEVEEAAPLEEVTVAKSTAPTRKAGNLGGAREKITYTVKPGDTLFDIAKAHKVSVADLQAWNDKSRRDRLKVGETITVGEAPVREEAPAVVEERLTVASNDGNGEFHEVKPGDYPAKIARDYDVPLRDFLAWNNLGSKSTIKVGDKLVVAAGTPEQVRDEVRVEASKAQKTVEKPAEKVEKEVKVASAETPEKKSAAEKKAPAKKEAPAKTYKVQKGDSASTIAEKHGIKMSDFLAWNGLTTKSVLQAGKEYKVSGSGGSSATPPSKRGSAPEVQETVHKVTSGQNPTTIARRYGVKISDLYQWNGWSKNHVLQVGDKVVIRKG